ncbi:MAG TPA: preprotein translocase subunit YajC [Hyphomonadaceae bacterium]|nr:preprotein translocase subunit YajC [Hyphomonadaceae bacterium]
MSSFMMFLQQAAAPAAGAAPAGDAGMGSLLANLMLPIGMIVIFYFLLIRPQNNRMKKHRAMLAGMKKGDKVVTQGGIIGRIFSLNDEEIVLDTGEGGKLRIARGMIVDVKNPTAPAPANDSKQS